MSGAVILCALGAIRAGAGYATVGTTADAQRAVAASVPEVLTRVLSDEAVLDGSALESFEDVLAKSDAIALGPGLGEGSEQRELVDELLSIAEGPLVVDADGLNILSKNVEAVVRRQHATVLTPHPAELGRLLDVSVAEIQADRLGAGRRAAKQFGAVVVLKGHRSVTAAPDGRVAINPAGGPELATAGTGDVLTGVVAALLAAGLDAFEAAWAATYLHGTAGRIAAAGRGISGVLASDVAAALPSARLSLETG